MKVRVKLPPGDLIEYEVLCRAIAQAVAPADEQPLEGMACIVSKLVIIQTPMPPPALSGAASMASFQSVLVAADGRTLEKLPRIHNGGADVSDSQMSLLEPVHSAVAEAEFPVRLSDDDRRYLEGVLPILPILRYPMSEEEEFEFMKAYLSLKDHPPWRPTLVTSATLEQRKAQQDEVMSNHRQALRNEFFHGRLNAVDRSYVGVKALSIGCYIPRAQAIAYLSWNGMDYDDQNFSEVPEVIAPTSLEETVELSDDAASSTMKPKLDDKKKQEIGEYYKDLKRMGVKDYTQQAAQKFGISTRYVRMIVGQPRNFLVPSPK